MSEDFDHGAYVLPFVVDAARVEDVNVRAFVAAIEKAQKVMTDNLNHNLYASYGDPISKPSQVSVRITRIRRYIAESLVTLAEKIGGYDVREYW